MGEYKPQAKTAELLDWCYNRIQEAPYQVTLRWLFYRALQEKGLSKSAYGSLKGLLATARKAHYKDWDPDTLTDDTRGILERGDGFESYEDWLEAVSKQTKCNLSVYGEQENIVMIAFEAEAMQNQFEYLTRGQGITLVPFRGDPSIPFKSAIAHRIEELYDEYEKPIVVLYFGDLDPKGLSIPISAFKDITEWAGIPDDAFKFVRCGLNEEQVKEYKLTDNPERPGQYQWEALDEKGAEELVSLNIEKYWDLRAVSSVREREKEATDRFRKLLTSEISG
jgi:hypothetical protein